LPARRRIAVQRQFGGDHRAGIGIAAQGPPANRLTTRSLGPLLRGGGNTGDKAEAGGEQGAVHRA